MLRLPKVTQGIFFSRVRATICRISPGRYSRFSIRVPQAAHMVGSVSASTAASQRRFSAQRAGSGVRSISLGSVARWG